MLRHASTCRVNILSLPTRYPSPSWSMQHRRLGLLPLLLRVSRDVVAADTACLAHRSQPAGQQGIRKVEVTESGSCMYTRELADGGTASACFRRAPVGPHRMANTHLHAAHQSASETSASWLHVGFKAIKLLASPPSAMDGLLGWCRDFTRQACHQLCVAAWRQSALQHSLGKASRGGQHSQLLQLQR